MHASACSVIDLHIHSNAQNTHLERIVYVLPRTKRVHVDLLQFLILSTRECLSKAECRKDRVFHSATQDSTTS